MHKSACRLCLATVSASEIPIIMCFGPAFPSTSPTTPEDNITVAEVLVKHFWFELHSERDSDAFVCQPCWTKVADFHRFHQSVLALYQARHPQREKDAIGVNIDAKLETTINEGVAQPKDDDGGPLLDISDDDGSDGSGEGFKDPFFHRLDIKKEENVETDECVAIDSKPRRSRTRSTNNSTAEIARTPQTPVPVMKSSSNSDSLIATYFTLTCEICNEPLANLAIARQHHLKVHKQRGYLCCGCGRRFKRIDSILEHCAFHSDPSPHKCLECSRIYASADKLAKHRKTSHQPSTDDAEKDQQATSSPDLFMGANKQEFNSLAIRRRADELIRRYIPLVCDVCGVSYETFAEARIHHRSAHSQVGYVECCGKRFVQKTRAVYHCLWHENPRQLDCTVCGRNFINTANLRNHMIRFHGTSAPFAYACDQCDSRFQLSQELRGHKQTVHMSVDERKYECYSCHRRFVYLSKLRTHLRDAPSTAAKFVCDVCAKSFRSKHTYEHHYAVEHGTVSLKCQCPECGKWLKTPEALARHQKRHTALPCTCDVCGNVLANAQTLNAHRRLVHGKATHQCTMCDKKFKKPVLLREHIAMHMGVTDLYVCAYCPKGFRSNSNMYKHRRQVHAEQFEVDRRAAKLAEDERNAREAQMAGND